MNIIEWIKANAVLKDGVDISEAESLVKDLDPLKNITTAQEAGDFIKRNNVFRSALDSEISKAVKNHDDKFMTEKLPDILEQEKEKIIKEINPEMTPEQKKLMELQERLDKAEKKEKQAELLLKLTEKSKELKLPFDPSRYVPFGEDAFSIMEEDSKALNSLLEEAQKGKYKENKPPRKSEHEDGKYTVDELKGKTVEEIRELRSKGLIIGL